MGKPNGFRDGYLCALSCIAKSHGNSIEIEDALRAFGPIDWSTVEPYDKECLQESIDAVKRRGKVPQ